MSSGDAGQMRAVREGHKKDTYYKWRRQIGKIPTVSLRISSTRGREQALTTIDETQASTTT